MCSALIRTCFCMYMYMYAQRLPEFVQAGLKMDFQTHLSDILCVTVHCEGSVYLCQAFAVHSQYTFMCLTSASCVSIYVHVQNEKIKLVM